MLDQWLLSRLQTLKSTVAERWKRIVFYNVVPQLFGFIEDLDELVHSIESKSVLGRRHHARQDRGLQYTLRSATGAG